MQNPYQIESLENDRVRLKYDTGEVFEGTYQELAEKQALAHINTKRWGQEQTQEREKTQQEYEQYKQQQVAAATGTNAASDAHWDVKPEHIAWFKETKAAAEGFSTIAEMDAYYKNLADTAEKYRNKEVSAIFLAGNPDFPNNDEAINSLSSVIDKLYGGNFTPENMEASHAYSLRKGLYKPLTSEEQDLALNNSNPQYRPTPPPMINRGSPESTQTITNYYDPKQIKTEDLRALAIRQQLEGK